MRCHLLENAQNQSSGALSQKHRSLQTVGCRLEKNPEDRRQGLMLVAVAMLVVELGDKGVVCVGVYVGGGRSQANYVRITKSGILIYLMYPWLSSGAWL